MRKFLQKVNVNGGELLGFILFAGGSVYLNGYMRYILIPPALACLFALINNLRKNKSELVKLLFYLSGSLCAGGAGILLYFSYWNSNAWLIAKIAFLLFVGFFIISSIIFSIFFICRIIKYIITNKPIN